MKTRRRRRKTIKISLSRQSVVHLDRVRTYRKGPWEDRMGWFLLFCFLVGHQLTCSWRQCLAKVAPMHWTLMGLFSCCCSPWFPAPPGPTDCGTATSPDKRNIISSKQSTLGMYTGQCFIGLRFQTSDDPRSNCFSGLYPTCWRVKCRGLTLGESSASTGSFFMWSFAKH